MGVLNIIHHEGGGCGLSKDQRRLYLSSGSGLVHNHLNLFISSLCLSNIASSRLIAFLRNHIMHA